jgi:acyl-CoA synthetase (AMP-forming)/AMP-acid ligase II
VLQFLRNPLLLRKLSLLALDFIELLLGTLQLGIVAVLLYQTLLSLLSTLRETECLELFASVLGFKLLTRLSPVSFP